MSKCTGYPVQLSAGTWTIHHDDDTCPVHERESFQRIVVEEVKVYRGTPEEIVNKAEAEWDEAQ